MRPASEIRQALFSAARDLVAELGLPDRGPSLAEMATRACVGRDAARRCIDNMRRAGHLRIVGERKVDYRNRPVKEYMPVEPQERYASQQGWADLDRCMGAWVQR